MLARYVCGAHMTLCRMLSIAFNAVVVIVCHWANVCIWCNAWGLWIPNLDDICSTGHIGHTLDTNLEAKWWQKMKVNDNEIRYEVTIKTNARIQQLADDIRFREKQLLRTNEVFLFEVSTNLFACIGLNQKHFPWSLNNICGV